MPEHIKRATIAQKPVVLEMFKDYLDEIRFYSTSVPDWTGYRFFDLYWDEADRVPFLILANYKVAGFALTRRIAPVEWSIAEFYILPKFRNMHLGYKAALEIISEFDGQWEVQYFGSNTGAKRLWKKLQQMKPSIRLQEL